MGFGLVIDFIEHITMGIYSTVADSHSAVYYITHQSAVSSPLFWSWLPVADIPDFFGYLNYPCASATSF
jgi:hypothetical protein